MFNTKEPGEHYGSTHHRERALHAHTNPGVHHHFPSLRCKSRLVGIIISLALLVLLGLLGPMQVAQAHTHVSATSGTWTLTGSLNVARFDHTATLLANGKVLVAGGGIRFNAPAPAELYDPSSGTWTPTGSLNVARQLPTATLLANGKVLVAGGLGSSGSAVASAELYDPSSGTWTLTGSLNLDRFEQTATLLNNGQVLVTGGFGSNSNAPSSAELYDPSSGTWTLTGSLNVARFDHTATLLNNGKVLVAGGQNSSGFLASAELFTLPPPDTTPPVLQLPGTITVVATSPGGAVVTYTVTATDPDNPPSQLTISCSPASGSTFPIGTTTVNCSATDPAGNTATGSFQVVVIKAASFLISRLIGLVNRFNLGFGLQNSLDEKLQSALDAVNAGDTKTACNLMGAFTNEVQAQSGKMLTVAQANLLLAAATRIQAVLGC